MDELFKKFLQIYKARLKPSTLRDYRSICLHHLSNFEDLKGLNYGLEEYLAGLEASGKRKNNILSAARCFMAWARRRELWEGNFYQVPRFPHRSRKTKPLNPEEARLVMDFSPMPYRDFFRLSILTGLRTGEALALKFTDFDLRRKIIKVRSAFSAGQESTTKTMAGDRDVLLSRPIWEIYERRRQGNKKKSAWFFYSAIRGVLSTGAIRKAWKGVLKVFEIEPRMLYATRHTFASLSVAAGEDPLYIAKVMGHSRPDQLFLTYASYLEGVKKDGQKFLELLGKETFLRVLP
jgi:integrase